MVGLITLLVVVLSPVVSVGIVYGFVNLYTSYSGFINSSVNN